jgi:hypothetical protein
VRGFRRPRSGPPCGGEVGAAAGWGTGGAEEGLGEANEGVCGFEAGGGVEGGIEDQREAGDCRGKGVGNLLLAAAGDKLLDGLDPGLDVGLHRPGEGGGGGKKEREQVALMEGEGVEEGLILGGQRLGLEGRRDHTKTIIRFMNGMSTGF